MNFHEVGNIIYLAVNDLHMQDKVSVQLKREQRLRGSTYDPAVGFGVVTQDLIIRNEFSVWIPCDADGSRIRAVFGYRRLQG